jgi:uncharacterized membrane protein
MDFVRIVSVLVRLIELAGILALVSGAIGATAMFLHALLRRQPAAQAYDRYHADLGRAILLGLEFLVAGDIINTVAIEPNFKNLGVLAAIVGIRTFLSFSLEIEITGQLPWRRSVPGLSEPGRAIRASDRS